MVPKTVAFAVVVFFYLLHCVRKRSLIQNVKLVRGMFSCISILG